MKRAQDNDSYSVVAMWIEPAPRANPEGFLDWPWVIRGGRTTIRSASTQRLDDYERLGPSRSRFLLLARGDTRAGAEEVLDRRAKYAGINGRLWSYVGLNLWVLDEAPVYRYGESRSCKLPRTSKDLEEILAGYRKVLTVDLRTILASLQDPEPLEILEKRQHRLGLRLWRNLVGVNRVGEVAS